MGTESRPLSEQDTERPRAGLGASGVRREGTGVLPKLFAGLTTPQCSGKLFPKRIADLQTSRPGRCVGQCVQQARGQDKHKALKIVMRERHGPPGLEAKAALGQFLSHTLPWALYTGFPESGSLPFSGLLGLVQTE